MVSPILNLSVSAILGQVVDTDINGRAGFRIVG
jgi:hypothetical protein